MNLLEQYIVKIHSEELTYADWTDKPVVRVDITTTCYGHENRSTRYYFKSEWEKIKEKGYYMG